MTSVESCGWSLDQWISATAASCISLQWALSQHTLAEHIIDPHKKFVALEYCVNEKGLVADY